MSLLQPSRTKFRKFMKGRIRGKSKGGFTMCFGDYGLKATTSCRVTSRQIEAARRAITNHTKRAGKLWIRIFPHIAVSTKPAEVRMGSGKGNPERWVFRVAPGRIMFELGGVPVQLAREALGRAADKLPVKSSIIDMRGDVVTA